MINTIKDPLFFYTHEKIKEFIIENNLYLVETKLPHQNYEIFNVVVKIRGNYYQAFQEKSYRVFKTLDDFYVAIYVRGDNFQINSKTLKEEYEKHLIYCEKDKIEENIDKIVDKPKSVFKI